MVVCVLLAAGACAPESPGDTYDDVGDDFETDPQAASGKADGSNGWPELYYGDANRSVIAAQYLLRAHGHQLWVDGDFGYGTESAARSFQRNERLHADGIVGASTWDALVRTIVLRRGSAGSAVAAVRYLLHHRYSYGIAVTSAFDEPTETAVVDFQTSRCLSADGEIGQQTWFALIAQASHCGGGTGSELGGASALLAAHADGRMVLTGPDAEGSSALDNIRDHVAGLPARRSARGHLGATRVYLHPRMVSSMAKLLSLLGHYYVSSIAGGLHSANSYHYDGNAIDVAGVGGQWIAGDSVHARELMRLCVALGATEVLGPSSSVPGAYYDASHWDHVHCGGW